MTEEKKQQLLKLIEQGKVREAIEDLLSLELTDSWEKEAQAISYRYSVLKGKERSGILSSEQLKTTENQVAYHLIELINSDEIREYSKEKSITHNDSPKIIHSKQPIGCSISIVGIIASITCFSMYFFPMNFSQTQQLTVDVTDVNGNIALVHEGELNTSIGNRPLKESIGEDGRTNFGDILPKHLGDTITIGFKADGWELADEKNTFKIDGKSIKLRVKKDDSLGIIKGVVKTRDGKEFIDNAKVIINADTVIFTNKNGIFNVVLPERMRVKNLSESYSLNISKEGFKTNTKLYLPKTLDAIIPLEKNTP